MLYVLFHDSKQSEQRPRKKGDVAFITDTAETYFYRADGLPVRLDANVVVLPNDGTLPVGGPAGARGDDGPPGPQGAQGPQGIQGETGIQGEPGATIAIGDGDPLTGNPVRVYADNSRGAGRDIVVKPNA